jgi:hypothetical protein
MVMWLSSVPAASADTRAVSIPDDVRAYFHEKAPSEIKTDLGIVDPHIKAIQKTSMVMADSSGKVRIEPSDLWTAAVYDTEEPVGVATLERGKDNVLSLGSSNDGEKARYLVTAEESGGELVEASQLEGAIFMRMDGTLSPLNTAAYHVFADKTQEDTALAMLQKKFDDQKKTGGGSAESSPSTWSWLWIVGVLALAIIMSSGIYMATSGCKTSHKR